MSVDDLIRYASSQEIILDEVRVEQQVWSPKRHFLRRAFAPKKNILTSHAVTDENTSTAQILVAFSRAYEPIDRSRGQMQPHMHCIGGG